MPLAPPRPRTRLKGISAAAFLSIARRALGAPYIWGAAAGPRGDDCSGLVQWALTRAGMSGVPRTSEEQYNWTQRISAKDLQPGDLVFEQWPGDGAAPGHVAIYTGRGRIEEAATQGVPVHEVSWSPGQVAAQGGRIVGYGRIPGMNGAPGGSAGGGTAAQLTSFWSLPGDVIGFFTSAGTALDWFLQPSNEIRLICGAVGIGNTLGGLWLLSHAGGSGIYGSELVPRSAALPMGIFLVGFGGVLLFIAFHNLPPGVTSLSGLLGHLQAQLKGTATGTPAPAPGRDTLT